jgi:hypothetical protein
MDSVRRIFGALLGDIEKESEAVKQDPSSHLAATLVSVRSRPLPARVNARNDPTAPGMGTPQRGSEAGRGGGALPTSGEPSVRVLLSRDGTLASAHGCEACAASKFRAVRSHAPAAARRL